MPYYGPGFTAPRFPTPVSGFASSPFGPNWERPLPVNAEEVLQGGGSDPASKRNLLIYKTTFYRNGLELLDAYAADGLYKTQGSFADTHTDLHIYYEVGGGKLFGNICYVSMNKTTLAYLSGKSAVQTPQALSDGILEAERRTRSVGQRMSRERLLEAIEYEVEVGHAGANAVYYLAMRLLHSLAEAIRLQKPTDKNWDANRKDYDPLLSAEDLALLVKGWEKLRQQLQKGEDGLREGAAWLRRQEALEGVAGVLEVVAKLYHAIVEAIDYVMKVIKGYATIVRYVNAFVCGVIAELLELVAGLIDFIALLVYLAKDKPGRDRLKKSIEQIGTVVLAHPGVIIDKVEELLKELKSRYSSEQQKEWQIAYNLGEDVVSVFLFIDGIVAAVKLVKSIPKGLEKLGEWLEKVGKRAKRVVKKSEKDAIRLLREKAKKQGEITPEFSSVRPVIMDSWIKYLTSKGVIFEIGTAEAVEILQADNCLGIFQRKWIDSSSNIVERTIYLYDSPSTSTFLEECYHALQSIEDVPRRLDVIEYKGVTYYDVDNWEYLAKKRILDEAGKNGISYEEYLFIENQLIEVLNGNY